MSMIEAVGFSVPGACLSKAKTWYIVSMPKQGLLKQLTELPRFLYVVCSQKLCLSHSVASNFKSKAAIRLWWPIQYPPNTTDTRSSLWHLPGTLTRHACIRNANPHSKAGYEQWGSVETGRGNWVSRDWCKVVMLKERQRWIKELHSPSHILRTGAWLWMGFKILPMKLYTKFKRKGSETRVVSMAHSKGTSDAVNILKQKRGSD